MQFIAVFSLLFVVAAMLSTQDASAEFTATSVDYENQIITIAIAQEPPQLYSGRATDQVSGMILPHVMEGLVRLDRRGKLVPGVATHWELDETSATFHLRKNALWSDGKTVTAHDFVFAWRKALEPETASEYSFILYPIKNAAAINKGELDSDQLGVTAVDDFTLKVELARPTAYFIKLTAFVTFLPVREDFAKKVGDRYAADAKDMLYNGPFLLTEWVHSASMKMVKNDLYWDKAKIKLNGINVDYITEDTRARLNLFADGKIVYTTLDGETYKDALTQKLRIRSFTTGSVFFIEYNHRDKRPTNNLNLRKAIQYAFDPEEFVNKVLATPGNLPGKSLFPIWLRGVDDKFRKEYPAPTITPDLNKAKAHLALALKELGLDKLPPLVLLVGNAPSSTKQAEYLQGLLKAKLGIELKIDVQTFKQRLAKMLSGEFDLVAAGWGPDYDDIMTFADLPASWNLNNRGRYNNPEYDRLIAIATKSTDEQVRMDIMGQLQQILFDDAVHLPMYEQGVIYLVHPKVKGMVRRVVGPDPDFRRARVIK